MKPISVNELTEQGILLAINQRVLHPAGLHAVLRVPTEAELKEYADLLGDEPTEIRPPEPTIEIMDYRGVPGGYVYTDSTVVKHLTTFVERQQRFDKLVEERSQERRKLLGGVLVQHIELEYQPNGREESVQARG